jgi:hypothetical protein
MAARNWVLACFAALAFACGGNNGDGDGDAGTGSGDGDGGTDVDAFEAVIDAPPFSGMCNPASDIQCQNCMDDDADGKIDGFDPECSGPLDDREDSFATGIPGDNMDATYQDCFFDGDSGGGNDGCSTHACCLVQAGGATMSPADDIAACMALVPSSNYNKYDRSKCFQPFGNAMVPAKCKMNCGKVTPPGCDCFGCCTVCVTGGCEDIVINPAVSPNCDQANVTDPGPDGMEGTADDPCKRCVKTADCGGGACAYDGVSCTPCPGQCNDADMNGIQPSECNPPLPASCGGTATCPQGIQACATTEPACPLGTYCTNGCCIGEIIL